MFVKIVFSLFTNCKRDYKSNNASKCIQIDNQILIQFFMIARTAQPFEHTYMYYLSILTLPQPNVNFFTQISKLTSNWPIAFAPERACMYIIFQSAFYI